MKGHVKAADTPGLAHMEIGRITIAGTADEVICNDSKARLET